jgi:hypothetical protein
MTVLFHGLLTRLPDIHSAGEPELIISHLKNGAVYASASPCATFVVITSRMGESRRAQPESLG